MHSHSIGLLSICVKIHRPTGKTTTTPFHRATQQFWPLPNIQIMAAGLAERPSEAKPTPTANGYPSVITNQALTTNPFSHLCGQKLTFYPGGRHCPEDHLHVPLLAAPRGTWALSASFNHPVGNQFVDVHGRAEGRILNGPASCVAPGCQLGFSSKCDGNKSPSGKDTSSVPRPLIGDLPYGVELKHCRVNGTVALTFDDGPYIYTSEALDILGRNGIKATFFIVGANGGKGQINDPASGYAPIIKRMWDAGHQIASHTWSHQDMTTLSKQQRHDQIVKNEIAIASILGVLPTYFRPPYAKFNSEVLSDLQELGYHVTNYDVDTRDWEGSPANSRSAYLSALSSRNPVSSSFLCIAHDIQERTVHGGLVQYMIDEARRLNYKLVTIGECMGDPRGNWYRDVASGRVYDPEKTGPKGPQDNKASASQTASAGMAAGSSDRHQSIPARCHTSYIMRCRRAQKAKPIRKSKKGCKRRRRRRRRAENRQK
ncbi:chitin deacetylase [Gaeumannomyces tritici R3-111a-1]|uniref:Chitin deacetylase n=1 Tax=Gaeumannomyces tritici (strain R3-111a-1) TaxID=644352 RepID=J3NQ77_GAET3|nr:chitin deacetylase [Gaeumannomyces tritici R3-111a-1]EJT78333.1 chitin deacetylase [Gaeumannomyces tritici R3-111a-1]